MFGVTLILCSQRFLVMPMATTRPPMIKLTLQIVVYYTTQDLPLQVTGDMRRPAATVYQSEWTNVMDVCLFTLCTLAPIAASSSIYFGQCQHYWGHQWYSMTHRRYDQFCTIIESILSDDHIPILMHCQRYLGSSQISSPDISSTQIKPCM